MVHRRYTVNNTWREFKMDQNTAKRLIEHYATPGELDHADDVTKCGRCLRQTISKNVAQSYLDAGVFNIEDMFKEIEQKWRETDLYKRVQELAADGHNLVEIERLLELEGIEI